MMHHVVVVVDGVPVDLWVPDEAAARALADEVLAAAEAGAALRVEVMTAADEELVPTGTLVLRFGPARSIEVRILPDDRTGAAMGISH